MVFRRTYRRKSSYRRAPYKRRTRRVVAPRKKRTLTSYVRRNAYKDAAQDRRLKKLENSQFGSVQQNLQVSVSQANPAVAIPVSSLSPICWDATDFTSQRTGSTGIVATGCRIWQVNLLSGTSIDMAGYWNTQTFENNVFWKYSNMDFIDTGMYKPIAAYYTIDWEVVAQPDQPPPHLGLHLITQKAGAGIRNNAQQAGANIFNLGMPQALPHLKQLADGDLNRINTAFFKVYKQRTFQAAGNVAAGDSGVGLQKHYYVNFSVHPKKVRHQLQPDPRTPGFVEAEAGQTEYGSFGQYQVDPSQPFWAILSSSARNGDPENSTKVKISRKVLWRDRNGATFMV